MNYIAQTNNYDEVKLSEIKYGLEGLYLLITKMIVIFMIAIVLNIFKELIIFVVLYNFIRMPSFGLHADKSWQCLVSSIIIFIGVPYLAKILLLPIYLKCLLGIIGLILMYKNAPADTKKRPIINKKRRELYKSFSILISLLFIIFSLIIKNNYLSNTFIFSILIQCLMISPVVYKIFNLPYNNYKTYALRV